MAWDVLVLGGGHNGLAAAAVLAKAGRKVALVERRSIFGGIAAGEEFHPGFSSPGLVHDSRGVSSELVRSLALASHGLERRATPVFAPQLEGPGLLLDRSADDGGGELGEDLEGFQAYRSFVGRLVPLLQAQLDSSALDISSSGSLWPLARAALQARRLGRKTLEELMRVAPSCVDDWLSELVSSPLLRAVLMAPGLRGTWMGPRSPTSAATLMLWEAQAAGGGGSVVGGPASLVSALEAACRAQGVELLADSEVRRIRVEGGRARGVELLDGSTLDAPMVLSALGPRATLLQLLDPLLLPPRALRAVRTVRLRGTFAKLHLALSEPVGFACRPELEVGHAHLGEHPLDLERGFDHAKHRRMPTCPPLDVRQFPCAGGAVLSVELRSAAFELDGGWTEERRAALGEEALRSLERYVPGLRDRLLGSEVLTPADLQARYALEGGHTMHGELALDQLGPLRPTPDLARGTTPIAGLFLGSSGVHPGAGLSGRSGLVAARLLLRS